MIGQYICQEELNLTIFLVIFGTDDRKQFQCLFELQRSFFWNSVGANLRIFSFKHVICFIVDVKVNIALRRNNDKRRVSTHFSSHKRLFFAV